MDPDKAFQKAVDCYHAGKLREAEALCKEIVRAKPGSVNALHLLGVVYYELQDYDSAIACLEESLRIDPSDADAYCNLGNAFKAKEQFDKAITNYQKAVQINPGLLPAYLNMGIAFHDQGRIDEAIAYYRRALDINPDLTDAYFNLGTLYYEKNRFDDAIACYQKAVLLDPSLARAYHNLGYIYQRRGQLDKAVFCYQKTLQLSPNHAHTLYNLGIIAHGRGRLDEAVAYYEKALQTDSNIVGAYYNLGTIFQDRKLLDEAIACYRRALALDPNMLDPLYNLGLALQEQGKLDEALASYDRAVGVNPDFVVARWARCMTLLPMVYSDESDIETSRARYREELINLRETISLANPQNIAAAAEIVGKQQPFYLAYQGLNDRELQQIYGELVCRIMSARYPQFADRVPMPSNTPGEPLRIGMVSGFFYYHAAWKIPIKGWIGNLDRRSFRLYGYYTGKKKDKETEFARTCFSRFVEDVDSFEELCKVIRNDNLHVLIYPEIGMNQGTVKLAALRLAPVQCASWGHPETSGLPTIDYFLSSDLIEPPGSDVHYTEKLVRLPNLSFYYTPPEVEEVRAVRSDFPGLRSQSVLYHCFQSLYKHLPQHDEIFPRIARQVGDCQFLFVAYPNSGAVVEQFKSRIGRAFGRYHLNAEEHTLFLPPLAPELYQALNHLCDVYLDTIGWSGCNSVLEALSCNLPVVTLPTSLMRGREGLAIHRMMGMTDTVAGTLDEYVALAARLGKDSGWRREISERIASRKHLVYYDKECIRGLEDFLRSVCE